jgi:thioredoxin 1
MFRALEASTMADRSAAFEEMQMTHPVAVTDGTFETEVLQASTPVLVDFWAEWCQPCKMIAPVLEKIANEQEGKLKIAKVNVDENPRKMSEFQIRGIPTLLMFKGGELVDTLIGFRPEKQIMAMVEKHLDKAPTG